MGGNMIDMGGNMINMGGKHKIMEETISTGGKGGMTRRK